MMRHPVLVRMLRLILLVCTMSGAERLLVNLEPRSESFSITTRLERPQVQEPTSYSWYTAQNGKMLSKTFAMAFRNLGEKVLKPRLSRAALNLVDHAAELQVISDFRQELTACVRRLENYFRVSVTADVANQRCAAPNGALVILNDVQPECSQDMLSYFLQSLPSACDSFTGFVGEEGITYAAVVSWLFGDPGTCHDDSTIVADVLDVPCGVVERTLIREVMDQVKAAVMRYVVSMTKGLSDDASGCIFDWSDNYDFKSKGRLSSFVPTKCAFHVDPQARCDAESTDGPLHSFRVGSLLGAGAFTTAWRVHDLTDGKEYALRVSIVSESARQHVISTTDPLSSSAFLAGSARFGSLQLVKCFAAILDGDQSLGFQLVELADGDLSHFLGMFSADQVALANAIESLLEQLARLHSVLRLSHNDLKPQNILYNEEWSSLVKIADYDTVNEDGMFGQTPPYAPPDDDGSAGGTRDMFAAGMTIYEMLKGVADRPAGEEGFTACFQKSTMQQFRDCSFLFFASRLQLGEVPHEQDALALHNFKRAVLTDVVIPCVAPKGWRVTADQALQAFESLDRS